MPWPAGLRELIRRRPPAAGRPTFYSNFDWLRSTKYVPPSPDSRRTDRSLKARMLGSVREDSLIIYVLCIKHKRNHAYVRLSDKCLVRSLAFPFFNLEICIRMYFFVVGLQPIPSCDYY